MCNLRLKVERFWRGKGILAFVKPGRSSSYWQRPAFRRYLEQFGLQPIFLHSVCPRFILLLFLSLCLHCQKVFLLKVLYQNCLSTCHLPCTHLTDPISLDIISLKYKRRIWILQLLFMQCSSSRCHNTSSCLYKKIFSLTLTTDLRLSVAVSTVWTC